MKVYNTLSGKKEEFQPQGNEVKMYVCGVTPYDDAHLGHAMSYIIFDVIRRYLKFRDYKVRYVQNVTDIDDKIINRANQRGISTRELADKFTRSYFDDMEALNVMPADFNPRATEEIPEMLELIKGLIDKGFSYPARGSVYFRVRKVTDYGKLSHRSLDSMMVGASVEPGEEKEDPLDFVLWKAAKPGEPSWDSPWGPGRPGWHIECSAMSLKYLGTTLDIHGGGQDLIFPHHENEIAQTESFTGVKPFARYWLHNGLVQLGGEKMSKSLGNLITIKEALKKYSADALRIFVLSSHYRSPLTYSDEFIEAAAAVGVRRLIEAKYKEREQYAEMNRSLLEARGEKTDNIAPADTYRERFISAMDDDFNTPQAIATLFDLASEINRAFNLGHDDKVIEHQKAFIEMADVLGLILSKPKKEEQIDWLVNPDKPDKKEVDNAKKRGEILRKLLDEIEIVAKDPNKDIEEIRGKLNLVRAVRDSLRKDRQFKLADEIRDRLTKCGFTVTDTITGTDLTFER
jgi:cysteinyl-tRNA synthetase